MNRVLDVTHPATFSLRRLAASCLQTTTLLGCVAIVSLNLALSAFFDHQRERVLAEAVVDARNLDIAFEQHVVRSIRNIDQLLLFARSEFARAPAQFSAEAISRRDYFPKDMALQLAVIGVDGMMIGSSLPTSGPVDLSDREHFRFQIDNPRDELFISKPVLGRVSNAWTVQFTRKLLNADGGFAGVLVASLDPYKLSRIYESIDIGASGAITLFGLDGLIRARGGAASDMLGRSVSAEGLSQALADESGAYTVASALDGMQRIVSYRRVPGFPLVVAVSLGRDEVLAAFETSRETILQLALLIDLAILALMGIGIAESYRLRSMREHLSAKSRMLASTFASMREGILLIDAEGRIVAMNELARDLLGLADGGFSPLMPYSRLPLAHREAGAGPKDVLQIALADGRTIEVKTSPLPDGGFVKTLNDITARIQSRVALEDARDKAEAATRARTAFLATMSHEIRTPLGGVLSMVDLIAGTKLDSVQKRYIEITRDSASHLLQLIDDVLDVTKLDGDHVVLEQIEFDLYRQIRSTLDIVSPRALERGLSIGCVMAPDVPRAIMGDPGRLRQVLINLLGNAVKFTASGHVRLDVSRKVDGAGERLCVRVEDTGIGIARDSLKHLFTDFAQIDSSISRRFGGTGLGLAISRKLVIRMGGSIGVESQPGAGSVFFFDLPLSAVQPAQPVVREPAILALAVRNAFERENLQRQFARSFTRVVAFDTLADTRAWIDNGAAGGPRRIVLVDAALELDGRALATGAGAADVILLCARQDMIAAEGARQDGYFGAVHKPLFPDDLRQCLDNTTSAAPAALDARAALAGKLAGLRVLIAEDNPTNQFALCRMLETMGADVVPAFNGREAIELAEAQPFDLVLMDVMMPEVDGLAAARALRSSGGPNAAIPIIALTASAFVEDREAALASGMDAFATKPITGHLLLETIEACRAGAPPPVQIVAPVDDAGPALDSKLLAQLREDLGPEHMGAALKLFFSDLHKRAAALQAGDRSAATLRKEAHALKGSAASFGFRHVAAAAARLEDAARANEADKLEALLIRLLEEAAAAPDLIAA